LRWDKILVFQNSGHAMKRKYEFISQAQRTSRSAPVTHTQPDSLDWTWLLLIIRAAIESMLKALVEIVDRQGYHMGNHYGGIDAHPRTWCRSPSAEGHTKADIEIYQVIRECADEIRSHSSTWENWLSVPNVSVVPR
jgi:hypothetical protein